MSDQPPSKARIPVTAVMALLAPPLGLFAWIALSGSQRRDYIRSNWVRSGFAVMVAFALPLLLVGAVAALGLTSDPNPNPIGLGLLLLFGGGLGTILVAIGLVRAGRQAR